jgi:hypothetical protein
MSALGAPVAMLPRIVAVGRSSSNRLELVDGWSVPRLMACAVPVLLLAAEASSMVGVGPPPGPSATSVTSIVRTRTSNDSP